MLRWHICHIWTFRSETTEAVIVGEHHPKSESSSRHAPIGLMVLLDSLGHNQTVSQSYMNIGIQSIDSRKTNWFRSWLAMHVDKESYLGA